MISQRQFLHTPTFQQDMQQDAIDCASVALEKYNIEKDIAAYIKKQQRKSKNCYCYPTVEMTKTKNEAAHPQKRQNNAGVLNLRAKHAAASQNVLKRHSQSHPAARPP